MVEGSKCVLEVLRSDFNLQFIIGSPKFLSEHQDQIGLAGCEIYQASQTQIESVGSLKSNDAAIAVSFMKPNGPSEIAAGQYGLVLDKINDPGNLGTLLRIADWYGIKNVICSRSTTDFYNPKVIQASMGSFTRVEAYYTDLKKYLEFTDRPIYGAFLKGDNIHQVDFDEQGFVLLGGESQGIRPELRELVRKRIAIPSYGGAESLNVAVAAAVICDNIKRTTG